MSGTLLTLIWATPLLFLLLCIVAPVRRHVMWLLPLAPLPALFASVVAFAGDLQWSITPLGMSFVIDRPASLLLGAAALLWVMAGFYLRIFFRTETNSQRFAMWWLLTMTGSLGVFTAADLVSFYLLFSVVSLAAYGLIVHEGSAQVRQSTAIYIGFAVMSEAFLLIAFVMLAATSPSGNLLIADAVTALPSSPWFGLITGLLILGFGFKIGLVPFNGWMPLTYAAAPIPAAAVLSGAGVKAGVIGFIRFMPFDGDLAEWGWLLVIAGLFSAFYGVIIGITQSSPKTILAYSSISQMGFIATLFGAGMIAGNAGAVVLIAFYAAHHTLMKGASFLAIGAFSRSRSSVSTLLIVLMVLASLGLAGLPFTGGYLAKLAVKDVLGEGTIGTLAALSAGGTALLMVHFLRTLSTVSSDRNDSQIEAVLTGPWAAVMLACLVGPWVLYSVVTGYPLSAVLAGSDLFKAFWPIVLGGVLAIILNRYRAYVPKVREGDIVWLGRPFVTMAGQMGCALEAMDTSLRRWPVAGIVLLCLILVIGWSMQLTP